MVSVYVYVLRDTIKRVLITQKGVENKFETMDDEMTEPIWTADDVTGKSVSTDIPTLNFS